MNRRIINNLILLLLLFAYTLVYRLVIVQELMQSAKFITASAMIVIMSLSIFLLGFRKIKTNIVKKRVSLTVILFIISYFLITYLIGLETGYSKNTYSLQLNSIIDNIFAPLIIIVCTEIFRYIIINANKERNFIPIFSTILIIFFEICTTVSTFYFADISALTETLTLTIIPIISKNVVMSYLTYETDLKPTLIYRLIMELYIFIVPIIPNLGNYINSIIGVSLPVCIYIKSSQIIEKHYNNEEYIKNQKKFGIMDGVFIGLVAIAICLISGILPYYALGIGSSSMAPILNRGDLIIIEKVTDENDIKIGDILVYEDNGRDVIHRLIEIKQINGETYYKTKGDANDNIDTIDLEIDDIKGKVMFKVPYIAYPSVYLTEALSK